MYKLVQFHSYLRLPTHIFKTKHAVQLLDTVSMSSNKRISDALNKTTPSKLRRVKIENKQSVQQSSTVVAGILNKSEMSLVEVMETPDQSEYDKKSYRVIRLANGLKCLLISDPTQEYIPHEHSADENKNRAATIDDDEDDDGDDEETGDEGSDEDAESNDGDEKRSKLAACSLCVDVGSFSDPRDVQGLAHFLGKFCSSEKIVNILIEFQVYKSPTNEIDNLFSFKQSI